VRGRPSGVLLLCLTNGLKICAPDTFFSDIGIGRTGGNDLGNGPLPTLPNGDALSGGTPTPTATQGSRSPGGELLMSTCVKQVYHFGFFGRGVVGADHEGNEDRPKVGDLLETNLSFMGALSWGLRDYFSRKRYVMRQPYFSVMGADPHGRFRILFFQAIFLFGGGGGGRTRGVCK